MRESDKRERVVQCASKTYILWHSCERHSFPLQLLILMFVIFFSNLAQNILLRDSVQYFKLFMTCKKGAYLVQTELYYFSRIILSSVLCIFSRRPMVESLRDELQQFVLPNVRLTGRRLGAGSYGSVEEIAIPGALCAAKKIHEVFLDRSQIPEDDIQKASRQFVTECRLMSTMRHPHIVQFLGVCFLDGSRLPALVMERLLTSLHDLLEPEGTTQRETKPYFPLRLKCSILYDAACGLAFLHGLNPPVIHRDLSARNVLVNSAMVAKIADLGMARILPGLRVTTMTKAPGAGIYMPPEALEAKSEDEENSSRYDVTVDIFSLGVVAIFSVSQTFPCNLLAPTYTNTRKLLVARTELERRETYMRKVYSQLPENHPLIEMIEQCLKNSPEDRPSILQVVQLLEEAKAEIGANECDLNKLELVQALKEVRFVFLLW